MFQSYCLVCYVEKHLRRLVTPGGSPHRHPYYPRSLINITNLTQLDNGYVSFGGKFISFLLLAQSVLRSPILLNLTQAL